MSLERGLEIIESNYQIVEKTQTDKTVVVKTMAKIQLAEGIALTLEGWEVQEHTATFTLPKLVEVPEFEDQPSLEPPPDQPVLTERD